jgi:hypothetical protein
MPRLTLWLVERLIEAAQGKANTAIELNGWIVDAAGLDPKTTRRLRASIPIACFEQLPAQSARSLLRRHIQVPDCCAPQVRLSRQFLQKASYCLDHLCRPRLLYRPMPGPLEDDHFFDGCQVVEEPFAEGNVSHVVLTWVHQ